MSSVVDEVRPDLIVLVQRKGTRIFKDIFHHHDIVGKNVEIRRDNEINSVKGTPDRILILDDSIRTGRNVKSALSKVRGVFPESAVSIATLITNREMRESLEQLEAIRFYSMMECADERMQNECTDIIFHLTNGSGIKYGTGYPGFDFITSCKDFGLISGLVRQKVAGIFGEVSEEEQRNPYKNAVKVIYRLDSYSNDGINTSDQKVFLYMDEGLRDVGVRIEMIVNPPDDELKGLDTPEDVSRHVASLFDEPLRKMVGEVFRGLEDHGYWVSV